MAPPARAQIPRESSPRPRAPPPPPSPVCSRVRASAEEQAAAAVVVVVAVVAAAAASGARSPERMPSGAARRWEDADSALDSHGGRARSAPGPGRASGGRVLGAGGSSWEHRGSGMSPERLVMGRAPVAGGSRFSWPLTNPVIRVTRSSLLREGDGQRQKLTVPIGTWLNTVFPRFS